MLDSLYHTIFKVNKKNAIALTEEFNFNEEEFFDIYRTFRPIVDVQIFTDTEIRGLLRDLKNEFVNENKVFDLKIFKRNNIELLEYDLKEYLICFERGKYEVWDKVKGTYFYHLKLESENKTPYHQTLLISDKNEVQIEIYFKQILIVINEFKENENNVPSTSLNTKIKTPTFDEDVKNILEIIEPLKASWNRAKILKDKDYEIFKDYVLEILKNGDLPKEVCQLPITNAPNHFISYIIYQVYKYIGKKHRDKWIKLIHLFKQFDNTEPKTTTQKFSNYKGDYKTDLETMITY